MNPSPLKSSDLKTTWPTGKARRRAARSLPAAAAFSERLQTRWLHRPNREASSDPKRKPQAAFSGPSRPSRCSAKPPLAASEARRPPARPSAPRPAPASAQPPPPPPAADFSAPTSLLPSELRQPPLRPEDSAASAPPRQHPPRAAACLDNKQPSHSELCSRSNKPPVSSERPTPDQPVSDRIWGAQLRPLVSPPRPPEGSANLPLPNPNR